MAYNTSYQNVFFKNYFENNFFPFNFLCKQFFFFKTVVQTIFFLIFPPADNFFYQIRYPPIRKIMVRPLSNNCFSSYFLLFLRNNYLSSSDQLRLYQNTLILHFAVKVERLLSNRSYLSVCICFILYTNEAKLWVLTGNTLLIATRKIKIQVQRLDFAIWHLPSK